jgi:hypothetical protein
VYRTSVPGAEKKQWVLRGPNGKIFEVRDPVAQGVEKTAALRDHFPPEVLSQYFVVLPGEQLTLDGELPASVLQSHDLPYVARMIRTNNRRQKKFHALDAESVQIVSMMIEELASKHTTDEHVAAVIASKEAQSRLQLQEAA